MVSAATPHSVLERNRQQGMKRQAWLHSSNALFTKQAASWIWLLGYNSLTLSLTKISRKNIESATSLLLLPMIKCKRRGRRGDWPAVQFSRKI